MLHAQPVPVDARLPVQMCLHGGRITHQDNIDIGIGFDEMHGSGHNNLAADIAAHCVKRNRYRPGHVMVSDNAGPGARDKWKRTGASIQIPVNGACFHRDGTISPGTC